MTDANLTEKRPNFTAYPQTEENCRHELSKATLDVDSFKQNRQSCSSSSCYGMCCYHGVSVTQETAEVIQRVVEEEADFFKALGLNLPTEVIVDDNEYEEYPPHEKEWEGLCSIKRTAVKEKQFSSLIKDYPSHFDNTACVFLLDDARCGLQALAEAKGLHPWYYKPLACWLFPILITPFENQPKIMIPTPETEPWRLPDGDGFYTVMFCGKPSDCGQLSYVVLEKELEFLGKIVGRNFLQEIQATVNESVETDILQLPNLVSDRRRSIKFTQSYPQVDKAGQPER